MSHFTIKYLLTPVLAVLALVVAIPGHAACGPSANENTQIVATTPTADFVLHDDGTVTHRKTGLMWMRCTLGQVWQGSGCVSVNNWSANGYTWQEALEAAAQVNAGTLDADYDSQPDAMQPGAGHADWRLPNVKELRSIVEERCEMPGINYEVFPGTEKEHYWSSSPHARWAGYAWSVYFFYASVEEQQKSLSLYVRLVRGGR